MIRKILLIRFSSLGDTLLCTPIARCLKEKGGYEVHFLTKEASAALLVKNPHIDKVHILEDPFSFTISDLKAEKFDFVIDLHKNFRSLRVRAALHMLFCRAESYPKLTFRRFLRIKLHCKKAMPKNHVVDRYFEAVRHLGIDNDEKGLEIYRWKKPFYFALPKTPFVAIAVGSRHFTKQIPSASLVELCQQIKAPVVLLGDAADKAKATEVAIRCPNVSNACGLLTLAESTYCIKEAALLISGDSALMHIATALDQNLISVWGSTIPELGMYPYFSKNSKAIHLLFENKNLACRPCHKHGYEACPKKHFKCMKNLDYKQIAKETNSILTQKKHIIMPNIAPKLLKNAPSPTEAFDRLLQIMNLLRKFCPWDKKQTLESLRYLTIEETYELSDAILDKDMNEIKKELGDVLLHIVFYAKIGEEQNSFNIAEVCNELCEKLIRRHPHIFAEIEVANAEEVKQNWESIKLQEKGKNEVRKSVLGGVPKTLPAMVKAYRIQEKARGVGFDWENSEQVWEKVQEEIGEFKEELNAVDETDANKEKLEGEFGDILFALINYARFKNINPEDALERTNKKFMQRFGYLEEQTLMKGISLHDLSLDEMDVYWEEAKKLEK